MGCETMKRSLELEKQRYRGLIESRVVQTGEAKTASDGARASNAILQKAIKEYDVRSAVVEAGPFASDPHGSPMVGVELRATLCKPDGCGLPRPVCAAGEAGAEARHWCA